MNETPQQNISTHVRAAEPGPVAFLATVPLSATAVTSEADLLIWLTDNMVPSVADTGQEWWLHVEHADDGYAVGHYDGGGWVTEATSRIAPDRILDGRCFCATAEIRFWWGHGGITGVRLAHDPAAGPYPATYRQALSPQEHQYLTRAGDSTPTGSRQGFQQLTRGNGQVTVIPCPNDGEYTLGTRTYYRADPGTGSVSIGAVCATGYRKVKHG